ncbi:uncharacterized protein FFUJ_12831 [Fusarium fujikuroi IMI 58289]|uniref:Uncharacterized protein n=1 Tax=Gibberella fujikuroi (strain CBS 195.34 / IMI 58289 / NRRL A-6831) TaxID=1279085 RepID=S0EDJ1_GIBF5|nr:uncharacterized protein FFUJ_12831 [Fusarium fujikuroi IMI 58289]QGI68551.1 hypothetical protein CEK27_012522 [Fusarium fujikuroi]CCT72934.1 uncharacterized protein FFUJ_12831 [Fusarium fujikuroi IMI 58289]SCO24908.1 uncharacterized protein FFM5_13870 [Fusarium fujikuroi]SCO53963.1 uncharacterized protein FFMR_11573 [Fusarium fujikuroi]
MIARRLHGKYVSGKLNGLDGKFKELEKSQCRCDACKVKEIIDDVEALRSANDQLEKDSHEGHRQGH